METLYCNVAAAVATKYALSWVTDNLAIGGAPLSMAELDSLRGQGITCILNLCAEFCDLHWIEAEEGFETYYLPIPDERAPEPGPLEKALEWIDEAIYLGKKVLIHCHYGVGRTGTVLTAYLIRKGFSQRMAEKRLRRVKAGPGNFAQWRFLRGYGKRQGFLTIREPALERGEQTDLSGLFARYEQLVERVERVLGLDAMERRCGQDHSLCCADPPVLCLVETVYLAHQLGLVLPRDERVPAVARAAEALSLAGSAGLCALSDYGECLLFDFRPLACRLADMAAPGRALAAPGIEAEAAGELTALSRETLALFAPEAVSGSGPDAALAFSLSQVVSGDYVRAFFDFIQANHVRPA